MGDVLVRKSINFQVPLGETGMFYTVGGSKGKELPTTSVDERTPYQTVAARRAAVRAQRDLGRQPLPSSESDPDKAKQIAVTRAGLKDLMDEGQSRSLRERLGGDSYERLVTPRRTLFSPQKTGVRHDVAQRAATRAGKVGVLGSRLGKVAGGALGLLTGATALSDASAAGQDFTTALGAGVQTGVSNYLQTAPTLARGGAAVGARLGEKASIMQQAMEANDRAKQVAVAQPTVNQVTGDPNKITSYAPQTSAPVAAPVNQPQPQQQQPVAVQQTLPMGPNDAAEALKPKPVEGSLQTMNEEQGAAGKKAADDFTGMGSMAGASSAGNQQKLLPEEDEEGQVEGA